MADPQALAETLDAVGELGVLPEAYRQLTALLEDPGVSPMRIEGAARVDPGLAAGILRLAHTRPRRSAPSPAAPPPTLSRALMEVGADGVRRLVVGATVIRMFRGMPEHLLDMRSFWEHSVAVGLLSALLGRACRVSSAEILYVGGLLHDVGTLALCLGRPQDARRVLVLTENGERPSEVVEREVLGFDHGELGAALLARWGIPEVYRSVALAHHAPAAAPAKDRDVVDIVHLADVAVSALRIGNAGERAAHRLAVDAWARRGLDPDTLEDAILELEGQLADIVDAVFPSDAPRDDGSFSDFRDDR